MTGRILTSILLLVLGGCAPPRPTSVLLVSLDTLRADAVAGMPNLARFATGGVSFPRVYAGSNWTLPSHATLLLSQPPSEHHAALTGKPPLPHSTLPAAATLLSEAFQSQGYKTFSSTEGGFLDPSFGFGRGFDQVGLVKPLSREPATEIDRHVDDTVAFVKSAGEAPVFAFVHTYRVHDYFLNVERFQSELLPEDEPWKGRGSFLGRINVEGEGAPPPELLHRLYRGAALDADRFLGRLLDGLRAADPGRHWLVSITSDHGESFGPDPRRRGHGTALSEDQLRVPWIAFATDPKANARLPRANPAALASAIDLAPSLLGFLGLAVPPTFRGRADLLLPRADGPAATLEASFVDGGDPALPIPRLALVQGDRALRSAWRLPEAPTFDCFRRGGERPGIAEWLVDAGQCRELEVMARDRLRPWVASNFGQRAAEGGPAASEELVAELKALGYL